MTDGEKRRIKILVLLPSLEGGGAEFVARTWAKELKEKAHQVEFALTHASNTSHTEFVVHSLRSRGFLGRVRLLRRHLTRYRYDFLLCLMPHWNIIGLVATRRLKERPRVVISGRNFDAPLRVVHSWKFRAETLMAQILYRRSDGYVAISHPVAAEAVSYYRVPTDRVWVVPNPAIAKIARGARRPEPSPSTSHGPQAIVVPARLVAQKRPLLALDVASVLRDRYSRSTTVHFFGHGPLGDAVTCRARELNIAIEMHGWDERWFEHAPIDSVVLLTSLSEGFGNVLVEAAASGLPAVASSRAMGVADAIVPGITGEFSAGDDAASFADAIIRASTLRLRHLDGWLDRFSAKNSTTALARTLEEIGDMRIW